MSDEVRQAAFIGAAINKGLGGIPNVRKKKAKNKKGTSTKSTTTSTASTSETPVNNPSPSKPALEAPTDPIFVKSERINKPIEGPKTNSITFSPKDLPTHGPGSEYNPNRGRQFNG